MYVDVDVLRVHNLIFDATQQWKLLFSCCQVALTIFSELMVGKLGCLRYFHRVDFVL